MSGATRCGGITVFIKAGPLCDAGPLPLSPPGAPSVRIHPGGALPSIRHIEHFYDHVRIEHMMFEEVLTPVNGELWPDPSRPGLGLEFKHKDAERFSAQAPFSILIHENIQMEQVHT